MNGLNDALFAEMPILGFGQLLHIERDLVIVLNACDAVDALNEGTESSRWAPMGVE